MAFQPSHAQRQLANQMSERRADLGLSHRAIAEVGVSSATLSRLERGQAKFDEPTLRKLAEIYGIAESEIERLCRMARDDRTNVWWHRYERWLAASFVDFLGCEDEASKVTAVETMFVPGLLQTPAYMKDLVDAGPAQDPDRVDVILKVRQQRHQRLSDPSLLDYTALIGESVLHWQFGSAEVLHEQLEFLRLVAERPNVSIRVLPFSRAVPAYSLDLFEFGGEDDAVLFIANPFGNPQHEDALEVQQARRRIAKLAVAALSEAESLVLIEQTIKRSKK